MVSKPLVSVLINNYNKEKYCNRAIKSILNQTYKNIELIFFDDGSTDNSVNKIKKSFSKNLNKIKIIRNRLRGKIYSFNQINGIKISIKKCKGEIICILDSDDFFKKDKIKNIVKFFEKNKNKNFVLDLPIYFYSNKKQIKSSETYFFRSNKWSKFPPTSCISFKKKKIFKGLKKISINADILNWKGKKPSKNVQSIARKKRYELLFRKCDKYKIKYILLGHHQDDLLENFFIRILRGSGLKGLISLDKKNKIGDKNLLRPLLDEKKKI